MRLRESVLLVLAAAALAQKEPKPPLGAAPQQPLPFSHRAHTGIGLKCLECHTTAATANSAGTPAVAFCMRCHIAVKKDSPAIALLAQHQNDRKPVEWVRVYRVPDFVYFSHRRHHQGKVGCEECHGEAGKQDVLTKVRSVGMSACQACHDTRKANNNCDACHVPHPE